MQCMQLHFKEGTVFCSKPSSPCIHTELTVLKKVCQQHLLGILHYTAPKWGSNLNHPCIYGFNEPFFSKSELLFSCRRWKTKIRKGNIISFIRSLHMSLANLGTSSGVFWVALTTLLQAALILIVWRTALAKLTKTKTQCFPSTEF